MINRRTQVRTNCLCSLILRSLIIYPTNKVFAYVTRAEQLLVFRHVDSPEAGIQIPGGTIESGELPEDAVLREAVEAIGLGRLHRVFVWGDGI